MYTLHIDVCVYSVFVLSCVESCSPFQGAILAVCKITISELINSEWSLARELNPLRQKNKKICSDLAEIQLEKTVANKRILIKLSQH
jgi:hypothetical protein